MNSHVSASGQAYVGHQTGVHIGDVLHGASFYSTMSGDPPERRQEVAQAHLDGGNPREAEEILRTLFKERHLTTERAYLFVLSVLSGRSFVEITASLSDEIHHAMRITGHHSRDRWCEALDVIDVLIRYAHSEYDEETVAQDLAAALKQFSELDEKRQNEIDRHLGQILSGAVQERITGKRKYQVAEARMGGDRVRRAWKFFEADPRPPMKWLAPPIRAAATEWRDAVLGSAALALAIVCIPLAGVTVGAVAGVGIIAAGGSLALRYATVNQTSVRHTESLRAMYWPQPYWHQQETEFGKLVDQCFRNGEVGGLSAITAGHREYLKQRLHQQYIDYRVHPSELKWLIMWHAARIARQHYYPTAAPPNAPQTTSFRTIGLIVWGVGLATLLLSGQFLPFLLAVGSWWGIRGIARIAALAPAQALLNHDADLLLAEEQAEYQRWRHVLADRPSDAEMARWLALDKAFLRDDALQRANLRERDLVTHVVLTERAPFARKSRVSDGPSRYEAYMVYVFLLTQYGMRTARTHLYLPTGDTRNEHRQMFTYDAVASVSVVEKGVRVFLADGSPSIDNRSDRVFQLTLLNGECVAEVREKSRVSINNRYVEDDEQGATSAAFTSGFDSALQVLEAVATEGRDWIVRDRERRQRWALNWCTSSDR
ncbi:hypothetical protein AB0I30_06600 [Nocardia tengchongensis]|uniref:hypothetical protein n=1 Tax=Nocardia tengchongensis TaxID=2055889 RepID=UPI003410FBF1